MITNFRIYENFGFNMDIEKTEISIKILHILAQFQVFHWQTEKMADHKTFDDFTASFKELGDKLMEVIQGKYGRITLAEDTYIPIRNLRELDPYQFVENSIDLFRVCQTIVFKEDQEIVAILDEVIAELQQLKYLFSYIFKFSVIRIK